MGTSRGSYPQVICFHLSPRNPGLSINISEKIVSQVGYPNKKLDIMFHRYSPLLMNVLQFSFQARVPKSWAQLDWGWHFNLFGHSSCSQAFDIVDHKSFSPNSTVVVLPLPTSEAIFLEMLLLDLCPNRCFQTWVVGLWTLMSIYPQCFFMTDHFKVNYNRSFATLNTALVHVTKRNALQQWW